MSHDIGMALCRLVGIDPGVTMVTAITVTANVGRLTTATVECITTTNDVGDIETLTRTFVEVHDNDEQNPPDAPTMQPMDIMPKA